MIGEDGTIYEAGSGRKRQVVGCDSQKEQDYIAQISEMQATIDNYYAKLVELGVIQPPKTAEEIARDAAAEQLKIVQEQARQQSEINSNLLAAIASLKREIGGLRRGNDGVGVEPCKYEHGQAGAGAGKVTGAGSRRNSASKKDAAGDSGEPIG